MAAYTAKMLILTGMAILAVMAFFAAVGSLVMGLTSAWAISFFVCAIILGWIGLILNALWKDEIDG